MAQDTDIRSLLATMLRIQPSEVVSETSLQTLNNSLSGTRLFLGLKRLGIVPSFQKVPPTFGELQRLLAAAAQEPATSPDAAVASSRIPKFGSVRHDARVGHDIQAVDDLPLREDYWAEPFYTETFTSPEIAYALFHNNPREHLAGFWAAKEALKKADAFFLHVDPRYLTVAHEADGMPFFLYESEGKHTRLPHSLSISHTAATASAVVLAGGGAHD